MASSPEIVFSQNVQSMNEWAMRTGIPLASRADDMNVPYRRAHRWLRQIKDELCARHGFVEVPSGDPRIMYAIECPPLRSPNGLQRSPPFRLQIPLDVTTFFAPQRRVEWEMQFHSAAFGYMRRSNPAILDLFNLLQSLITGVIVLVMEERNPGAPLVRTIRALPMPDWVANNGNELTHVLGVDRYRALYRAAGDKRMSYKLEQELH